MLFANTVFNAFTGVFVLHRAIRVTGNRFDVFNKEKRKIVFFFKCEEGTEKENL